MDRKEEFYSLSAGDRCDPARLVDRHRGGHRPAFRLLEQGPAGTAGRVAFYGGRCRADSARTALLSGGISGGRSRGRGAYQRFQLSRWGMLEKLAPTFLAGMPAHRQTGDRRPPYLAAKLVRTNVGVADLSTRGAATHLRECGGPLRPSRPTRTCRRSPDRRRRAQQLKGTSQSLAQSIRFNKETDSLNCSILGPDAGPARRGSICSSKRFRAARSR